MGLMKRIAMGGGGGGLRPTGARGMDFGAIDFRFHLHFQKSALARAADRRARGILSAGGAFVRTAARSALKYAPQKALGALTAEEREGYNMQVRIARQRGRRRPRRPERTSQPGKPPLLHRRPSPLKRLIFFAYDPVRQSVVIGPLAHGRHPAPHDLEYGGWARIHGRSRRVRARPFMRPALATGLAALKRKGRRSLPRSWDRIATST